VEISQAVAGSGRNVSKCGAGAVTGL
jgi:hypothetical protein